MAVDMDERDSGRTRRALLLATSMGVVAVLAWVATPISRSPVKRTVREAPVVRMADAERAGEHEATDRTGGDSVGALVTEHPSSSVVDEAAGTREGLSVRVRENGSFAKLVPGAVTHVSVREAAPHVLVVWEARIRASEWDEVRQRLPRLAIVGTRPPSRSLATRPFGPAKATHRGSSRRGLVRVRIEWSYEILGIDAVLGQRGRPLDLEVEVLFRQLRCARRFVLCVGMIPINLALDDEAGADGRVVAVAIVHLVAVRGLADVELELLDGQQPLAERTGDVFLDGNRIDVPAAIRRPLVDSYLEVRARVSADWSSRSDAWARLTVRAADGTVHRVSWDAREID